MRCESCKKRADYQSPVNVVSDTGDKANYMLVCDECLRDPEKWVPGTWERVVDSVGKVWWVLEKEES